MSLAGEVKADFDVGGYSWELSCSADKVLEGGQTEEGSSCDAHEHEAKSPNGRILVVEDEPLIAFEVAQMLEQAGFDVLGPAGSVGEAFNLMERSRCDAAVLDVNLGTQSAEPIALWLTQLKIPFVAMSGYSSDQLSPAFNKVSLLSKPLKADVVVDSVKHCLTTSRH